MRAFIIGGGERGLALTRSLVADGHAVRFVVEDEASAGPAREAGAEAWVGTPDRIGTLRMGLESVTLLLWLQADCDLPEIHGSRLKMMLEKTTDTTVRGVVYEAGSAHEEAGLAEMEFARRTNEIPYSVLRVGEGEDFAAKGREAIDEVLAVDRLHMNP